MAKASVLIVECGEGKPEREEGKGKRRGREGRNRRKAKSEKRKEKRLVSSLYGMPLSLYVFFAHLQCHP